MERLESRVAVITGSTRGLGLELARRFLQEGTRVVVSSRSEEAVAGALASLSNNAVGLPCDVANLDEVRALKEHALTTFGRLDIWVNNAGVAGVYGPTIDISSKDYKRVVSTNILGVYHGSLVAMRHFEAQGSGKLINLLGRGDKKPVPYQNAYAPSKAWVRSFTRALAKESVGSGVGVFAFNPGLVRTDLLQKVDVVEGFEPRLDRLGVVIRLWAVSPDEAAEKAVWLASSATDGKSGLELQAFGFPQLVGGLGRELGRRLQGKKRTETELKLHLVPKDTR